MVLFYCMVWHGTAQFGSLGTVPGTLFNTTSVEVPSEQRSGSSGSLIGQHRGFFKESWE